MLFVKNFTEVTLVRWGHAKFHFSHDKSSSQGVSKPSISSRSIKQANVEKHCTSRPKEKKKIWECRNLKELIYLSREMPCSWACNENIIRISEVMRSQLHWTFYFEWKIVGFKESQGMKMDSKSCCTPFKLL